MTHPTPRRVGALTALLTTLLGLALVLAGPASAHATVVGSDPADGSRLAKAPAQVTITFDENVGIGGIGYLHVTDGNGKRVDAGAAEHPGGDGTKVTDRLRSGLGDSTYTASYRVISADSHPVAGTIRFVVGHGAIARGSADTSATDGATAAAFDAVRWISYTGFALLGGVWLLLTVWSAGRASRRAQAVVGTGLAAVEAGAVLELLLQGPFTAGEGPGGVLHLSLLRTTLQTNYGQLHVARIVLLGLLAAVLVFGLREHVWTAPFRGPAAALIVTVALTFSAAGHADTTNPRALSIALDALHLLAMAAWIGGLVVLVAALLPRRTPDELRAVLPVFSTVAFGSVVVLAGTGTYAAWRGIGSLHAILTTTYGLLVLAKVLLFVGLIALGNVSRAVVQRRYAQRTTVAYAMTDTLVEQPVETDDGLVVERLRRSVLVEVVVGLCVLALSAVLVAQPRGAEALAARYRQPVTATGPLGAGRTVTVVSDPGTHGTVQLSIDLGAGRAARSVTATATQNAAEIGPIPVRLASEGTNSYSGTASLPVAGAWEIDLVVTMSAFDATTTDVTLHLH